ncbi:MAG: phospholipid carrier-dependent glycosyltransferase [Myxococcota bacterium]
MTATAPSAADPAPPWSRAAWIWLVVVTVVAAALIIPGLGDGTMRPYDEGLYGKLARNALEYDVLLHAVDTEGQLYDGFTKPPLTIALVVGSFQTFGVSLFALRLPFAIAMLGLVMVAFAWGRRIAGIPMAVTWAGTLLLVSATTRWGRVACIEPMLMLWITMGLWAYHEALLAPGRKALRWAIVAGLALAMAVATKQLVVAIAIAPILGLELWRRDGRSALRRLAVVLGLPLLAGGTWVALMLARHGASTFEIYLRTGVLRRVSGFSSGHSARSLNELTGVVAEACAPFPWVLGLAGLVVLLLARRPRPRHADGALLLPLLLVVAIVVYDNASQSLLPWYAFDLVVPLTGGIAFMVAGLVVPTQGDALAIIRSAGGALVLAAGAVTALASTAPQLDLALLAAAATVALLLVDAERHPRLRRNLRHGLLAAAALALFAGDLRRPERRPATGGHEQLMEEFARRGIGLVQANLNTKAAGEHSWGTYYGPRAQLVKRPPWGRNQPPADAYVTATIWPREYEAPPDVELIRVPGLMALVGNLDEPPWRYSTLVDLLKEGPVTFEAEDLPSSRDDVLVHDPQASGEAAKALVPYASIRDKAFLLSHGPGLRFLRGDYQAEFWLQWHCPGTNDRPAAILHINAGREKISKVEVPCRKQAPTDYEPVTIDFELPRAGKLELRVQYVFGEVWHDRTLVRQLQGDG